MKIKKSFEIRLKVPFHDLDPMNVVWHGNYLKYFDMARFALFDSCGISLHRIHEGTGCIFPVIKTSTKYIHPLQHGDDFLCKATVDEARVKIVIDFEIRLLESGKICTKGKGEQVAVKIPEMEMLLEIPEDIRRALIEG